MRVAVKQNNDVKIQTLLLWVKDVIPVHCKKGSVDICSLSLYPSFIDVKPSRFNFRSQSFLILVIFVIFIDVLQIYSILVLGL